MHPADQFEAWRDLIDKRNMPLPDIAARFRGSEKTVTQRMELGRVAPALLDLYREGDMDLEQVMAFTLTDDHEAQLKIWNEAERWQRNAHAIRQALMTEGEVAAADKRVRFVTLEGYEAAGGAVRRDLFWSVPLPFPLASALLSSASMPA
jgi:ParB family chromosome partitioning protein